MNTPQNFNLSDLIELSKIDQAIERIEREKKRLALDLEQKKKEVIEKNKIYLAKSEEHKKLKESITKEEKSIREEEEKLRARRVALQTLSNYKLQQSAEKEIELAAKALNQREDATIKLMEQLEAINKEMKAFEEEFKSAESAFKDLFEGAKQQLIGFEGKSFDKAKERAVYVPKIPKDFIGIYDKVRQRHPETPVVSLVNKVSCGGCSFNVGPQLIVQIARNSSLVKCPACSRIVFIE